MNDRGPDDSALAFETLLGSRLDRALSQCDAAPPAKPLDKPMAPGVGGFNIDPPVSREDCFDGPPELHQYRRGRYLVISDVEQGHAIPPRKSGRPIVIWGSRLSYLLSAGLVVAFTGFAISPLTERIGRPISNLWTSHVWTDLFDVPVRRARLVVEGQKGAVNEPLHLGIAIEPASGNETVTLTGLASGAELSLGQALNSGEWVVAVADLDKTFVGPPRDFVGTMEADVTLRSVAGRVLDTRKLEFEWIAPERSEHDTKAETAEPENDSVHAAAPHLPSAPALKNDPSASAASDRTDAALSARETNTPAPSREPAGSSSPTVRQFPELIDLGQRALEHGDVATARLLFRRAATAGDARAALKLAFTFDPEFLERLGAVGVTADLDQARLWYEKAAELGSNEAPALLRRLAHASRQP